MKIPLFVKYVKKKRKKQCWLNINVYVEILSFGEGVFIVYAQNVKNSIIASGYVFFVKNFIV